MEQEKLLAVWYPVEEEMMKIINGLKYWGQLLLLPFYWLSFLMPRDRRLWLFGSTFGRRFADNPKYFYLYVSQHREELGVRPVWISHSREIVRFLNKNGYEAYYYHSVKGIWFALRGKVYLFDNYAKDINFWQSGGAVKVNLWHGIPLKKIQADNIFDKVRHPRNLWEQIKFFPRRLSDEKPSHYVLTTSKFMEPVFSSAFGTENVLTSGYPRNDRLIKKDSIRNLLTNTERRDMAHIMSFVREKKISRIIYYMPTFRDSEIKFFGVVGMEGFRKFLQENRFLFCVKLHPKSKLKDEFRKLQGDSVFVIDADADPYVFLEKADVLVTDYSSIYFDFLLTGRPVVFFDYDLQAYLRDSREMYFDYEEFTPGRKASTEAELKEALREACSPDEEYNKKYSGFREAVADKVFDNKNGTSCRRLVKDIKTVLKEV